LTRLKTPYVNVGCGRKSFWALTGRYSLFKDRTIQIINQTVVFVKR